MARRLHLVRYEAVNQNYLWLSAFRLRLEVDQSEDMDPRVFLYRRDPVSPHTGEPTDTFITVCSPVDMEDFPPEEPDPAKRFPFFRRTWMELDFRTTREAEEVYLEVLRELDVLIVALNRLAKLKATAAVWLGGEPPADSLSESLTG